MRDDEEMKKGVCLMVMKIVQKIGFFILKVRKKLLPLSLGNGLLENLNLGLVEEEEMMKMEKGFWVLEQRIEKSLVVSSI